VRFAALRALELRFVSDAARMKRRRGLALSTYVSLRIQPSKCALHNLGK
jgi:hypothetical protein